MNHLKFSLLIILIGFILSCSKPAEDAIRNPDVILSQKGLLFKKMLPERNSLLGYQYDSLGKRRGIEYNLISGSIANVRFYDSVESYTAYNNNLLVTCKRNATQFGVDLFNVLDSTFISTISTSYSTSDCKVANGKLFTLEILGVNSRIRVYDLSTNAIIDSFNTDFRVERILVSHDGSHVFGVGFQSFLYKWCSFKINIIGKFVELKKNEQNFQYSLFPTEFTMLPNGTKFILNSGIIVNDKFEKLSAIYSNFYDFTKSYIGKDEKTLYGFNISEIGFFEGNNYRNLQYSSVLHFETKGNFYNFIPFSYNNSDYCIINYFDDFLSYKTIITKLTIAE